MTLTQDQARPEALTQDQTESATQEPPGHGLAYRSGALRVPTRAPITVRVPPPVAEAPHAPLVAGLHAPLAAGTHAPVPVETRTPLAVAAPYGDPEAVERYGPVFGVTEVTALDADLTRQHPGEPHGERITVSGRVVDRSGRPVAGQLVEIWQANASGRYAHRRDQHPAPLDPSFTGTGRCLTDAEGRYAFTTIKPGAYPWGNHENAWRPAHIHFSLFGRAFTQRLITQMYFPGDPLLAYDPILHTVTDEAARNRLVAAYDPQLSSPDWSLGYCWDIVLDGPEATLPEPEMTA